MGVHFGHDGYWDDWIRIEDAGTIYVCFENELLNAEVIMSQETGQGLEVF